LVYIYYESMSQIIQNKCHTMRTIKGAFIHDFYIFLKIS
jgi:hypothetical protein